MDELFIAGRWMEIANLTGAQMLAFDDWFENSIKAGALRFLAFVGWPVGGNPAGQWYEATFAAPYAAVAQTGDYWTMTAKLRLHGTGAPATPALSMTVTFASPEFST